MPSYTVPNCPCCTCTDCRMMAVIWNCNGVTDDDFALYLNGSFVASMNETDLTCTATNCRGHLVIPTGYVGRPSPASCGCHPAGVYEWETIVESPVMDSPTCPLDFELRSTSNHGCGNYGLFLVYQVCSAGDGSHTALKLVYSAPYDMPSFGSNFYSVPAVCPCPSSSSSSSSSANPCAGFPDSYCVEMFGQAPNGGFKGQVTVSRTFPGSSTWDGTGTFDVPGCGTKTIEWQLQCTGAVLSLRHNCGGGWSSYTTIAAPNTTVPNYDLTASPGCSGCNLVDMTILTGSCGSSSSSSSSITPSSSSSSFRPSSSSSGRSSGTSSTSSVAPLVWECDVGFCSCFEVGSGGRYATEAECLAACCSGSSSGSVQPGSSVSALGMADLANRVTEEVARHLIERPDSLLPGLRVTHGRLKRSNRFGRRPGEDKDKPQGGGCGCKT